MNITEFTASETDALLELFSGLAGVLPTQLLRPGQTIEELVGLNQESIFIRGDDGSNTLSGVLREDDSSLGSILSGQGGNDRIIGSSGIDLIIGGSGFNRISGEDGGDAISGGNDTDFIRGGNGGDLIAGRGGNDILIGDQGGDAIFGGAGNDRVLGGSGGDLLNGGSGNDRIFGNSGDDLLIGGEGSDLLIGGSGGDRLDGGSGNDTIFGNSGDDLLIGGEGSDLLIGGSGNDNFQFFLSSTGSDTILGFAIGQNSISILDAGNVNQIRLGQSSQGATVIDNTTHQTIATLNGVQASTLEINLSESGFVTIA